MTEWEFDMGHVTRLNVLGVYEQDTEWPDLISEKLGHLLPKCRVCGINAALASLDAEGEMTADVERQEALRLVRELGPERLKQWAVEEVDELLALRAEERRELLEAEPHRFRFPHLVDELLERCEAQLTKDARRALELAELAVDVSLRLDPKVFHDLVYHTRARAEAHRANCLRINDQRPAADEAFRYAHWLYEQAQESEPELSAEIAYLKASLSIDQRRFDEAEELLADALGTYRHLGNKRLIGLTLLKQAHAAYQRGEPSRGLSDLETAAAVLHETHEPKLVWSVGFSEILYAIEAGDIDHARRRFDELRRMLEQPSEPWCSLRLIWLRAKLAHAEGDLRLARDLYRQALDGFVQESMGFDAASVALELALLHMEAGDTGEVPRLAAQTLPIFHAQDIHREALAALALFQETARAEGLTVQLVRRLRRYFQLARADPSLKLDELEPAP